jgi:hypothetical protein
MNFKKQIDVAFALAAPPVSKPRQDANYQKERRRLPVLELSECKEGSWLYDLSMWWTESGTAA